MEATMEGNAAELLIAAFLSMQPPAVVVSFTREVGVGYITEFAQQFFLDKCYNNEVHVRYPSSQAYSKRVVKEIILGAERDGQEVKKDLYDIYLESDKVLPFAERCYKTFSFMMPETASSNLVRTLGEEVASELIGMKLLTVRVSLNLLDGDTGYCVWPAGLYLAEVLLSHPQLVRGKSCLELGSGTGICGMWLSMLAPSKAVLTDGALSTLANLRHNLEINGIPTPAEKKPSCNQESKDGNIEVDCRQLIWDTVSQEELGSYKVEVIIGADLVYDPTIVPSLVRVLAMVLQKRSSSQQGSRDFIECNGVGTLKPQVDEASSPVAYLASALRNLTTLHLFFSLAADAGLKVIDVTEIFIPLKILPKIYISDSSQIRLHKVFFP